MKKNLEILDYEDKKTQAGKRYVRFKTSEGWMSCFDSVSCDMIKNFEGKSASCEVVEQGDFQNIKKCYGKAVDEEADEDEEIVKKVEKPSEDIKKAPLRSNNKYEPTSMYVSYAKDIFCATIGLMKGQDINGTQQMKNAIELVKQAKEAFE